MGWAPAAVQIYLNFNFNKNPVAYVVSAAYQTPYRDKHANPPRNINPEHQEHQEPASAPLCKNP
ncbi:uncharacterized protein K441DRAFT_667890 [Cenococcum geophilum 1.58]|uniref:uncharacterized protein n=1 Tax=Cenococcum geophilum 1.58 TaxID=794803 RepID=UPI00358E8A9D|nr:hypothetical protein K441DRAFT_667890 [Cenococcum geophilum 1.58]